MRFLDASAAQQQAEQEQAEVARQRELRQARKQMIVLLLGLIVAIGLALWAYSAQQRAEQAKEQAIKAKQLAESSEEQAIKAKQLAESSETRALLAVKQAETARQEATDSANESMESFRQALVFGRTFLDQLNNEKTRKVLHFQPVRKELGEIALKYYNELIQRRGNDPSVREQVWNLLGVAFHTQGKLDDAVAAYRKQLEIKPDDEKAWYNLGIVLAKQGKLDDAVAAFRKHLEIKPDDASAWYNLGIVLADQGKLDDAVAA